MCERLAMVADETQMVREFKRLMEMTERIEKRLAEHSLKASRPLTIGERMRAACARGRAAR